MTASDNIWEERASDLLDSFAASYGAAIERRHLTELLVQFRVVPGANDAAPMTVYAAPDQLVVEAGHGTRFELNPLPDAASELLEILNGVAEGGLHEQVGRLGIKFRLTLKSGETRTGRVVHRTKAKRSEVRYGAY
jgi:hypothetical protein